MRLVYVPLSLPKGIAGPVLVTDADGHPHAVTAGRIAIVDGPLCVVAQQLRRRGDRLLVRFQDDSECWIRRPAVWRLDPTDDESLILRGESVFPVRVGFTRRMPLPAEPQAASGA